MISRCVLAGIFAALMATSASADAPTLIGSFQDWSAFQTSDKGKLVCFASAKPKSSEPKKKRDEISFMITDWPGRRIKAEVEIVPGFAYKDGSPVSVQVGAERFELVTQNDGSGGSAWVGDAGDERRLVDAMSKGSSVVVTGTSTRGTTIKDTYSLSGISAALDKVHATCGM